MIPADRLPGRLLRLRDEEHPARRRCWRPTGNIGDRRLSASRARATTPRATDSGGTDDAPDGGGLTRGASQRAHNRGAGQLRHRGGTGRGDHGGDCNALTRSRRRTPCRRRRPSTRGGVFAITNAIIDTGTSTGVFGWAISHVKRVVSAALTAAGLTSAAIGRIPAQDIPELAVGTAGYFLRQTGGISGPAINQWELVEIPLSRIPAQDIPGLIAENRGKFLRPTDRRRQLGACRGPNCPHPGPSRPGAGGSDPGAVSPAGGRRRDLGAGLARRLRRPRRLALPATI